MRAAGVSLVDPGAVEVRASVLLHAGAIIRERKLEFAAWRPMRSARTGRSDADVAELSTSWSFYAREALRLARRRLQSSYRRAQSAGLYSARDWGCHSAVDFPFAIMAG